MQRRTKGKVNKNYRYLKYPTVASLSHEYIQNTLLSDKGPYIKYDRNLGGIAVSISNSDVMLFTNVILQSEGVKKGQQIAVILNVWPLIARISLIV